MNGDVALFFVLSGKNLPDETTEGYRRVKQLLRKPRSRRFVFFLLMNASFADDAPVARGRATPLRLVGAGSNCKQNGRRRMLAYPNRTSDS